MLNLASKDFSGLQHTRLSWIMNFVFRCNSCLKLHASLFAKKLAPNRSADDLSPVLLRSEPHSADIPACTVSSKDMISVC